MNLYELTAPRKRQAGLAGGIPIYFPCGQCGTKEPEIHGFIGAGPEFNQIAVRKEGHFYVPMMLCGTCFDKKTSEIQIQETA